MDEMEGQFVDEMAESRQRKVKRLKDPKAPFSEEREEHEKTHLPYRSWCKH